MQLMCLDVGHQWERLQVNLWLNWTDVQIIPKHSVKYFEVPGWSHFSIYSRHQVIHVYLEPLCRCFEFLIAVHNLLRSQDALKCSDVKFYAQLLESNERKGCSSTILRKIIASLVEERKIYRFWVRTQIFAPVEERSFIKSVIPSELDLEQFRRDFGFQWHNLIMIPRKWRTETILQRS